MSHSAHETPATVRDLALAAAVATAAFFIPYGGYVHAKRKRTKTYTFTFTVATWSHRPLSHARRVTSWRLGLRNVGSG